MGYPKLEREADVIYVIWYLREPYYHEDKGKVLERLICFSKDEYERQLNAIKNLRCDYYQCTRIYKIDKEVSE